MGERRYAHGILLGRPEEEGNMEESRVDGIIILKQMLKNWDKET